LFPVIYSKSRLFTDKSLIALAGKPAFKENGDMLESSALAALGIFMSFVPDLLPK